MPRTAPILVSSTLALLTAPALAAPPDFGLGLTCATIADPGNRAFNDDERLFPFVLEPRHTGIVDYTFDIMNTEVTAAAQLEFVTAYWNHANLATPTAPTAADAIDLIGRDFIGLANPDAAPGQDPGFFVREANRNKPAQMGWRNWARFANWLHNDKALAPEAFATGAYDTATFESDGITILDNMEALPGARVRLPNLNEWTKAMHWDPAKDNGAGGYWLYPHSSDEIPIQGALEDGGETDANMSAFVDFEQADVDAYPNALSPWGLFGGIGGESEALDATGLDLIGPSLVIVKGDDFTGFPDGSFSLVAVDDVSGTGVSNPIGARFIFIPATPGTVALLAGLMTAGMLRRR